MKQKDFTLLAVVIIISATIAFVVSNIVFSSKKRQVKVVEVAPISETFKLPDNDDRYKLFYNSGALNPTKLIQIGGTGQPSFSGN